MFAIYSDNFELTLRLWGRKKMVEHNATNEPTCKLPAWLRIGNYISTQSVRMLPVHVSGILKVIKSLD